MVGASAARRALSHPAVKAFCRRDWKVDAASGGPARSGWAEEALRSGYPPAARSKPQEPIALVIYGRRISAVWVASKRDNRPR
jgi:hypothetical protein